MAVKVSGTTVIDGSRNIINVGNVDGRDVSVDGAKLDGIAAGAEVNQNAFSSVVVAGQSDVVADAKTDALNLAAGTGVSITTDASTDTVTFSANIGTDILAYDSNLQSFVNAFTLPTADGTNGQVLTTDGDGTLTFTTVGGGLTEFTEARSTATPNATIPVHSIAATGAETNIDVALVPKGNGAFSLQVADNTTAGGNKRGRNAVDLQTSRIAASRVASGDYSFAAGSDNTAGMLGVAIGNTNSASGFNRVAVAIGQDNTATGDYNTAIGSNNSVTASGGAATAIGRSNSATGDESVAIGVSNNSSSAGAKAFSSYGVANGTQSTVIGGGWATANSVQGVTVFGFQYGLFDTGFAPAPAQHSFMPLRRNTTDATTARATSNNASGSATNQRSLRNNSAVMFEGKVAVRENATGDMKAWQFKGAIKRGANAGSTAIVGSPSVDVIAEDAGASTWGIALSADTTNGALAVDVTGEAGKTLRWAVVIHSVEIMG